VTSGAAGHAAELFAVLDVTGWELDRIEAVGDSAEVWLSGADGAAWLYKPRPPYAHAGADWAERVTTEIAGMLTLPAARVELVRRGAERGTISRNVRPDDWELQHGALLLAERDESFQIQSAARHGHDLTAIQAVLQDVLSPPRSPDEPAFDVFAGYLLLDALVANPDRHEMNWAVLRPPSGGGPMRLSPTWDHGSALGHNLTDAFRERAHEQDRVEQWASNGRAHRFDARTDGRLSLVELAARGMSLASPKAQVRWWSALEGLQEATMATCVARVPELSDVAVTFTSLLLRTNRRRLLDARDHRT
jgi:hypothetical protein